MYCENKDGRSILELCLLIGKGQFIKQSTFKLMLIFVCILRKSANGIAYSHRLQIRTSILSNYLWPTVNHVLLQFVPFNGYQMAKLQLQDLSCTQHLWFLNCFISYFLSLCMSFQILFVYTLSEAMIKILRHTVPFIL